MRLVLALLALALVAAIAGAITLHTAWGRDQVRAQIEAKLRPYFPAGARIGRLEGSVLGDFELRDIELRDREGRPAVTIDRVRLNVELAAWLDDEARLESVIVEGLAVELHQRAGEPPNVATMFQPNPDPLTFDVVLEHLAIRDGAVTIERDGRIDHLDGLTVTSALTVKRAGAVHATAALDARWRERAVPIALAADVAIDPAGVVTAPAARLAVGDVALDASDVRVGGGLDVRGALHLDVPAGAVARLVPELALPNARLDVHASVWPAPGQTVQVSLRGQAGGASILGGLAVRPLAARPSVGGTIMVRGANARDALPALPATSLDTTAIVALVFDRGAWLTGTHGTIGIAGQGTIDAVRFDRLNAGLAIDGPELRLVAEADGAGDTRVTAEGRLTVSDDGDRQWVDLRDGRLRARSSALERAASCCVAVAGALDVDLRVDGRVLTLGAPAEGPGLAVRGTVAGQRLRRDDVWVGAIDVALALDGIPARPGGSATVATRDVRVGGALVPDVTAAARGRMGGGVAVSVRADDRVRDLAARVDADITLPPAGATAPITIALGSFEVRSPPATITGKGGRVVVTDRTIVIDGLRGDVAGGHIAIDVVAPRERPTAVSGVIAVTGIDLARLKQMTGLPDALAGTLDARIAVERGRARGRIELRDPRLGEVTAALDVALPRRPTDPAAWLALDRRAVRELRIEARAIDLGAVADALALEANLDGTIDAAIAVGSGVAPAARTASVRARGVTMEALPAPLDLEVAMDLGNPSVSRFDATATLRTLGTVTVSGAVRVPFHVLDPEAWARIDVGAVDDLRVRVERLVIGEDLARLVGVPGLRGVITAGIDAERALSSYAVTVVARDLTTGPAIAPVGVTVQLNGDRGGATGTLTASLAGATVATASLSTSRDVVAFLRGGGSPTALPLRGELTIAELQLDAFGRSIGVASAPSGTVRGTATLAGTIGAPTGEAEITVENLGARRRRRAGGELRGGLRLLTVNADYAAGKVHATAKAAQDDGGTVELVTDVDLGALDAATASIVAQRFELRPLAQLVPDVLFGVSGKLDADLRLRGFDPDTATLDGSLQLTGGVLPVHDLVGVLRDTRATVRFEPSRVTATLGGSVEAGRLEIEAEVALKGIVPQRGSLTATAAGLELITSSAPRVDGTLRAELERAGATWNIAARVQRASVTSRVSKGRDLHPSSLPRDLVYASTEPGATVPLPPRAKVSEFVGDAPTAPLARIALDIEPVAVATPLLRGEVTGRLAISVGLDGATVEGKLDISRGDVTLLERRYRLRRASVTFDGSIDPRLDVQLERDLPELTLFANVTGRASDPELTLSSDPATFTQGQLLAFALSDTASAPGSETTDAASNLLAAVASQAIVGAIAPILPVHLDVIAYEPASASSSRAFVFGRWITRKLLVLYRNRAEARTDENVNEAEVEYWLNRRVLIEAVAGDRGILGADLLWTRRW